VAAIREAARGVPGLHLVGNYLQGRSIGESVEIAFGAAEEISQSLGARADKADAVGRA